MPECFFAMGRDMWHGSEQTVQVRPGGAVLPLRRRDDLVVSRVGFGGRTSYVVKEPLGLTYHRLHPTQYELLDLLREEQSLEQLQRKLNAFDPAGHWEIRDLQQLLADLHEKGLLISLRPGQGRQYDLLRLKRLRQSCRQTLQSLLFLRLPGWSPRRILSGLEPLQKVLLHPVIVGLMLFLTAAALLLVAREHREFQQRLPALQQFFHWENLPYLWVSVILAKIVHEFGHALVCRHCGAEPRQIGVMLLVFTPTLYCDVTDAWMLTNKWQRIMIGLGGVLFESTLAALAVFFWWWTEPGAVHFLCLNLFVMSTVTNTIFNLNPLMKFDGYYVLADYLEIPNLKQQADRAMLTTFCRLGLGVELPRDPLLGETQHPGLLVYGISAWLYRWVVMLGITMFLFSLLKPVGMERFAFLLLAITLGMMGYGMGRGLHRAIQEIQPVRPARFRYGVLGLCAAAFLAGLALLPIPYWVICPFELEPQGVAHVHTVAPGRLDEVFVEPGETVQQGEVLATFSNPDLEQEILQLQMQYELTQMALRIARLQHKDDEIATALDQLASLTARLQNRKELSDKLTLRAPIAGRVIPAVKKATQIATRQTRLPQWSGSLFQRGKDLAWLEAGTPVLAIAPTDQMQAVLLIDQQNRNDVHSGQKVTLHCAAWSGHYWQSEISEIAARETSLAPESLSRKSGGTVETIADEQGREKLLSAAYRGIVPLPPDEMESSQLMGTTGQARVTITHRTILGWAWRLASQTFRFRL